MTRLQKMMFLIVIVLLVGVLSFDASLYFAQNVSPNRLKVNYYPLQDSKIPESLDDVTIVYFTDLQYGTFQNDTRTKRLFDQIRELNPDVLVFGGDLYDSATEPDEKSNKKLTEYFRSIQAPMGKYAVYGEKDWSSPTRKKAVKQIYHDSQIELLHNKNIRITDKDSKGIRLIGLTSTKGISKALDNVSGKTYNLLVTHKPDNFMAEALAQHSVSYGMAGHSHGTQLDFPLIGGYKVMQGAEKINRESLPELSFPYIVSSGTGCTKVDIRYNATPEINVFVLKHQ